MTIKHNNQVLVFKCPYFDDGNTTVVITVVVPWSVHHDVIMDAAYKILLSEYSWGPGATAEDYQRIGWFESPVGTVVQSTGGN